MRKILMAATAMFSVGMLAGHAQAQMPAQPVTTDSFTAGQVLSGANPPAPGTVTVTLRFRNWTDVGYGSDTGTVGKGTNGLPNGNKNQNFQVQDYFRIYPRLDGVAANGVKYGVSVQIRQNSGYNGSTAGSSGGNPNLGNTLYVRNAGAYLGLPALGTIWAGQVGTAVNQFMTGTQEDWDAGNGGWNGDSPDFVSGGTSVGWAFPEDGGTYTVNRLVYISPKFAVGPGNFDFGFDFEPSYSTGAQGANSLTQAGSTSGVGAGLTSSILTTQPNGAPNADTRKNTYTIAGRYVGTFSGATATLEGGYWGSGVVGNSSGLQAYKGISVVDVGAKVVIGALEFGAHYDFGSVAGSSFQPKKAGAHNENAFIGGAEYTIGQGIIGIQYINEITAGGVQTKNGLHEVGLAFGGGYAYAPGAEAYLSVLYGVRHQAGVDLLAGAAGPNNNNTQARAIGIGNRFDF